MRRVIAHNRILRENRSRRPFCFYREYDRIDSMLVCAILNLFILAPGKYPHTLSKSSDVYADTCPSVGHFFEFGIKSADFYAIITSKI